MFVESLFNLPGVKVEKVAEQHFCVIIKKNFYKSIAAKLHKIFFDNFERISLLQKTNRKGCLELIIIWRADYSRPEIDEGGGAALLHAMRSLEEAQKSV
jgi:hypothetical protein